MILNIVQKHVRLFAGACVAATALTMATPTLAVSVTNTNDTGPGSLRQAITDANNNGPSVDTITFAITNPVAGVRTILPATPVPTITTPVILDGTRRPAPAPTR